MEMERTPQKAVNAEMKIAKMCEMCGVTSEGEKWLTCVLDPFKDMSKQCFGMPSMASSRSVVQEIVSTVNIQRPASVPVGSNYDAYIVMNNIITSHAFGTSAVNAQGNMDTVAQNGAVALKGGLEVYAGPVNTVFGSASLQSSTTPNNFLGSPYKLLGMAFEIRDTSAIMVKQGTITVARIPARPSRTNLRTHNLFNSGNALLKGVGTFNIDGSGPYQILAVLMQQPGTRQMESDEGCYCVSTLNDVEDYINFSRAIGFQWNDPSVGTNLIGSATSTDPNNIINIQNTVGASGGAEACPFNYSVAHIGGANSSSTYTVTCKWLIQKYPSAAVEPNLAVLAKNSPPYDANAFQMYSSISNSLPVGCPVADNAAGDWINAIADIMGTMGVPGMPIVKAFTPKVGGWIDSWYDKLVQGQGKIPKQIKNEIKQEVQNDVNKLPKPMSYQKRVTTPPAQKGGNGQKQPRRRKPRNRKLISNNIEDAGEGFIREKRSQK